MKGLKVTDQYSNILTVLSVVDNIVKVYERINDTIHASRLFLANGKSLMEEKRNER